MRTALEVAYGVTAAWRAPYTTFTHTEVTEQIRAAVAADRKQIIGDLGQAMLAMYDPDATPDTITAIIDTYLVFEDGDLVPRKELLE